MLNVPNLLLLTETWLSLDSALLNIDSFISSPRVVGRGGGVAIYVHNAIQWVTLYKSYEEIAKNNIDVLNYWVTLQYVICIMEKCYSDCRRY